MADVLSEKDHTDCVCSVLEEHLAYGKIYAQQYREADEYDLYINYVLNPRVEYELLRPYRKGILSFFTEEQKAVFRENPAEIWNYIRELITAYPYNERETVMETPYECLISGIGTERSQKVLFVAIARTLGIPARLNPGSHVMECWDKCQFVSVLKQEKWSAALYLKKGRGYPVELLPELDHWTSCWKRICFPGSYKQSLGRRYFGTGVDSRHIPDHHHQPPAKRKPVLLGKDNHCEGRRETLRNSAPSGSTAGGYAGAYFPARV